MSYKVYEEYKDSNVDWIGALPNNWTIQKLKFLSRNLDSKRIPISAAEREEGEYPYYGATGIVDYVNDFIFDEDLLLVGEDGAPFFDINKDVAFLISGKTWVNNHAHVLKINENIILDKLVKHSLNCTDYSVYIKGSTRDKLNQEQLKDIPIIIPPKNEQQQIAKYLDKKTSKIDETILKNQQLIELLEEKRISLINEVVTKGLNPDVPMKDSGVEWIGEIPEHWEIRKFAHIAYKIVVGYVGSIGESYTDESGIPLIKTENIQNGKLTLNKLSYVTKEFHLKNKKSQIKPGDILIARHGESGRSCVVPDSLTVANSLNIVILQSGKDMNGQYYSYLLNSSLIQEFMQSIQGGAVQGVVNTEDIAFLRVHVPPKIEQNQIVDFLNHETSKMDKIIEKIKENIALLEEFKTSLIYHVVTGKIEVRGESI